MLAFAVCQTLFADYLTGIRVLFFLTFVDFIHQTKSHSASVKIEDARGCVYANHLWCTYVICVYLKIKSPPLPLLYTHVNVWERDTSVVGTGLIRSDRRYFLRFSTLPLRNVIDARVSAVPSVLWGLGSKIQRFTSLLHVQRFLFFLFFFIRKIDVRLVYDFGFHTSVKTNAFFLFHRSNAKISIQFPNIFKR